VVRMLPTRVADRSIGIITGEMGAQVLAPMLPALAARSGRPVRLVPIANAFFGGNIGVTGLLTGAIIGLAQDALTSQPIGLYSLTKTVVGYGASSLGVKLDVENAGARFLVTLFFYLLHEVVYFTVARGMLKMNMHYTWQHELSSALLNAVLAVALFAVLDRFKQRT